MRCIDSCAHLCLECRGAALSGKTRWEPRDEIYKCAACRPSEFRSGKELFDVSCSDKEHYKELYKELYKDLTEVD